jgi:hypothetical protein
MHMHECPRALQPGNMLLLHRTLGAPQTLHSVMQGREDAVHGPGTAGQQVKAGVERAHASNCSHATLMHLTRRVNENAQHNRFEALGGPGRLSGCEQGSQERFTTTAAECMP